MAPLIICLGVALFALLALLGDTQFALHEQIPVHWSRGGERISYAPRRIGLAIFPVTGTLGLVLLLLCRLPVFVLTIVLLILAAANLVYFRAIGKRLQDS